MFGKRLREMRQARGETHRSLAEAAGLAYPYIAEMEGGRKVPSLTTRRSFADPNRSVLEIGGRR